ncbi:MAG: hypothetical protein ACRDYV_11515 [Acidimicrobiia bacterium]
MLAESPSIDGGVLLIVLLAFAVTLALAVGTVVVGCMAATRAGRGSQNALIAWVIVAALEGGLAVLGLLNASPVVLLPGLAALVLQVALYQRARRTTPPPPPS